MIYAMTQALQDKFYAKKFPTAFEYGPRRLHVDAQWLDHLVIVERDREASDTLEPVNGARNNPRCYCNRGQSVKATIYARSNLDGARVNEHEAECEQIVDAFIVALFQWGTESKALLGDVTPTISERRYLKLSEFPEAEAWPGVVYLIRFRVMRGVYERDYEGNARPIGSATGVANELDVQLNGVAPAEVVTFP